MTYSLVISFVALGLAGWVGWFAWLFGKAQADVRAHRLELVTLRLQAADEQVAKETALRLLDLMTIQRNEDMKSLTAQMDALQHKYNTVKRLYQDSIAIDGPLASRRLQ